MMEMALFLIKFFCLTPLRHLLTCFFLALLGNQTTVLASRTPTPFLLANDTIRHKSIRLAKPIWIHAGVAGSSLTALYFAWYRNYPQGRFRTFDDAGEWLQMDKAGHVLGTYTFSRYSTEVWRRAGYAPRQSLLLGSLMGLGFQTAVEVMDGFSTQWGWSWSDVAANALGTSIFAMQDLFWQEQRLLIKTSFSPRSYQDPVLQQRNRALYGMNLPERCLKDYNGQTYWISANLRSFLKNSTIPDWINVAVGYGAEGLFGARSNRAIDAAGQVQFDRTDIPRYRQWFLSPDIDFQKIKTDSRFLKTVFYVLNVLKCPAPALEYSQNRVKLRWFFF
jgi:hypothetical protein